MARKSKQGNIIEIHSQLVRLVSDKSILEPNGGLDEKIKRLIPIFHALRDLGSSFIPAEIKSARDRMLYYLQMNPLKVVSGDELMVAAGINDWPRRLRELRVEFGWDIISGQTAKEIASEDPSFSKEIIDFQRVKNADYILLSSVADSAAAARWNSINSIRRQKDISASDKILKYLQSNVGSAVSAEEIRYVSNDQSEWARRVRELRTESGWPIATPTSGRPDLPRGTYMLEENVQAPEHDRYIPDQVRVKVLERDSHSCVKCKWSHEKYIPDDPRNRLELHHKVHHAQGGKNTVDNLATLCNMHHAVIHASKMSFEEFLAAPD